MVEARIAPKILLGGMILIQLLWLSASWFLRAGEASPGRHLAFLVSSTLFGLIVFLLPEGFASIIQKVKERLPKREEGLILILSAIVLIAGTAYAKYNKVFLDEPENFNASRKIVEEGIGVFFAEYSKIPWLGKQHPPLIPLINGLAMGLFGIDLFVIRMVTLMFGIATLILTYYTGKELYDRNTGLLAASIFIGFPFLLCLGSAALTDIQVTFFFTLAIFLGLRLRKSLTLPLSGALGLAIGLGILTKYTMFLIFPVLFGLLCTGSSPKRFGFHIALAILVAAVIVSPWFFYCWESGLFALQKRTITRYSKVVTVSRSGTKLLWAYLLRGIPRGFGPYNLLLLFLGGVHLLRQWKEEGGFFISWIAPAFLFLCLTLPDPRYFMPVFPGLAIIAALGLKRAPGSKGRVIALAWLFCGVLLIRFAVVGPGRLI